MSTTTDLLARTVEIAQAKHQGRTLADGHWHCLCGWVSPNKAVNAIVTGNHHRARMIAEAVEREWA